MNRQHRQRQHQQGSEAGSREDTTLNEECQDIRKLAREKKKARKVAMDQKLRETIASPHIQTQHPFRTLQSLFQQDRLGNNTSVSGLQWHSSFHGPKLDSEIKRGNSAQNNKELGRREDIGGHNAVIGGLGQTEQVIAKKNTIGGVERSDHASVGRNSSSPLISDHFCDPVLEFVPSSDEEAGDLISNRYKK